MIKTRSNFLKVYKAQEKKPNDIIEVFDFVRNEKGELTIEKVSEYSQKEYINSFAEECTLANQIARMNTTGDIRFLNAKNVTYGDISEIDELMTLDKNEFEKKQKALNEKLEKLQNELNELKNPVKEIATNVESKQ